MCVYVCVSVCVCLDVCMCVYMHMLEYVCVCTCVCMYLCVCAWSCLGETSKFKCWQHKIGTCGIVGKGPLASSTKVPIFQKYIFYNIWSFLL